MSFSRPRQLKVYFSLPGFYSARSSKRSGFTGALEYKSCSTSCRTI